MRPDEVHHRAEARPIDHVPHCAAGDAAKSDRLNFGEPPDNQPIKDAVLQAIENKNVVVRPVRVELPATATPGPRPGAGTAAPTLHIGKDIPLSGS